MKLLSCTDSLDLHSNRLAIRDSKRSAYTSIHVGESRVFLNDSSLSSDAYTLDILPAQVTYVASLR